MYVGMLSHPGTNEKTTIIWMNRSIVIMQMSELVLQCKLSITVCGACHINASYVQVCW